MKKIALITACSAALAAALNAQTVTTDPVGFVSVTVPAASDAAIGAPLGRATEYQGVIQSISGTTITVAGTPGWTANQFVYASGTQPKTYFARIDSGLKEGLICTVTANGTGDLTVTLPSGEDLTNVSTNAVPVSPATTGDSISVAPYWTPATLVTGVLAGTQLLIPSNSAGINLASVVYLFNGTNWLQGSTNVNDTPLAFGQGFILRNNSTTTAQTISITGAVPMSTHRMILKLVTAGVRQDVRFFYNSPIPETLSAVFGTGAGVLNPGDQILAIDNTATGKNKPATTLTWNGTNWLQGSTVVTTTYQLQPGASYVFRKNSTGASSVVWSDLQGYLQ